MKYTCIIVEDNILERDALAMKLKKIEHLTVQAVLADGMRAASFLRNNEIDIVFSDIDMPDLSGIELLKSIKHPPYLFLFRHILNMPQKVSILM